MIQEKDERCKTYELKIEKLKGSKGQEEGAIDLKKHSIGTFKKEVEALESTNVGKRTGKRSPTMPPVNEIPEVEASTQGLLKGTDGVTSQKYLASEKLRDKKKKKPASVRSSRDKEKKSGKRKAKSSRKR